MNLMTSFTGEDETFVIAINHERKDIMFGSLVVEDATPEEEYYEGGVALRLLSGYYIDGLRGRTLTLEYYVDPALEDAWMEELTGYTVYKLNDEEKYKFVAELI